MTGASNSSNGASLEDCHTNFFALADLSGIKWRRLYTDSLYINPLEDPILVCYSKCLAAGILTVWRRVNMQKTTLHHAMHDTNTLSCHKELWIFWYGEEPDFNSLEMPNLAEAEQGSWENGLSYECRTLLFKALHNLIERCLLSRGFTRLGRFFLEPQPLPVDGNKRNQIAFAFNFFIHGDSTVCASVDTRQASPVYGLHKCHLVAAQRCQKGLRVILSPYGMEGRLTGHGYKYSDPHMARFLNEWHQFYPHPFRKDKTKMDSELPNVLEVLTGGVRMKYPTSYVFVTEDDHTEACQEQTDLMHRKVFGTPTLHSLPTKKPSTLLGLLTPPMSPGEVTGVPNGFSSNKTGAAATSGGQKAESPVKENVAFVPRLIKESVQQECCFPVQQEKTEDTSTLWDFQDPMSVAKCGCLRKSLKSKHTPKLPILPDNLPLDTVQSLLCNAQKRGERTSFYGVPFHRLKPSTDESFGKRDRNPLKSEASKSSLTSNGVAVTSLPQLHSLMTHSRSVESHLNAVELLVPPVISSDPMMPTLSPQPPVIKSEDNVPIYDGQSQQLANGTESKTVPIKEKVPNQAVQATSPASMQSPENAKSLAMVNGMPETVQDSVLTLKEVPQVIKKPQLPKRIYEDENIGPQTMSGVLYDYRCLKSNLWEPPAAKKSCFSGSATEQIKKENDGGFLQMNETMQYTLKDPYEFTECDEAAPYERGFRPKTEIIVKEEEKIAPSSIPSPEENSIPALASLSNPVQHPEPSVPSLSEEASTKLPTVAANRYIGPKFIREEDLTVSFQDLDNIFDTSSEDEDNMDTSSPLKSMNPEDCPPKPKSCAGISELSRMYPTPPSLEQNAVPSPLNTNIASDAAVTESDTSKENAADAACHGLGLEMKEIEIWKPPAVHTFLESPKYSPWPFANTMGQLNLEFVYKPSWLLHNDSSLNKTAFNPVAEVIEPIEKQQMLRHHLQQMIHSDDPLSDTLYTGDSPFEPQHSASLSVDATSPLSYPGRGSSEAHSLIVNLLLSDSLLNLFKDHNFESCCVCVCNMNIGGSDVGITLPNALMPSGNEEPQYRCMCGFSAVVHRHRSSAAGLFYEDELEATGFSCDTHKGLKKEEKGWKEIPAFVLEYLRTQCRSVGSTFSLFHKFCLSGEGDGDSLRVLELYDGCEVCFLALESAKHDDGMTKLDDSIKYSCLHKWPYVSSPLPSTNHDIMLHLEALKPLLQIAVHKKNTRRIWDVTYIVSGPLTWREFHRLAARGTEDQCEPQPIPSLIVGYDKDCAALSPFSLKYWDKLLLEPYSLPRDVAYIVVAPESDVVLSHVIKFFRELSSIYELHRLGRHRPITKVLRNGIMRVGKTAASKVAEEPIDEWFDAIGDGPIPNKLKLYARVCKHRLAPHLSTLSLDRKIFGSASSSKPAEKPANSTATSSGGIGETPEKPLQSSRASENDISENASSNPSTSHESSEDDDHNMPALVIYIVEPFTFGQHDPGIVRMVTLGLLHTYAEMLSGLPEVLVNSLHIQLLSLDSIMCIEGNTQNNCKRKDQLKSLALSVYSQTNQIFAHQIAAKSLTGFGPAAAQDMFLGSRENKVPVPMKIYNKPYILASYKDKKRELGENFGDRKENSGVLYCSYCLTEDKRYIVACCTNSKGEFTETNVINIGIPNRSKRKPVSVRKFGLQKLFDFILDVISVSVHPWRVIIERFGRIGHGELKVWASLLSRKSLHAYTRQLRDRCNQCNILGTSESPSILSVCLVSVEPDSALRIMADHFSTPDERFKNNNGKRCQLNTPEDATCTHILVFPTSATTQSSQATFHQEHIDPLPGGLGEDIFEALNDDDITVSQDINDIFRWESPTQSPANSPRRDSSSQPSSPIGRHSHAGGPNRSESVLSDNLEEPLPLLQQPLALGYYVSTSKTGCVPKWFWSSCPQLANKVPVFLKSALLIHLPFVQQSSDDLLHSNTQQATCHPLDSNLTTDVLRYVLEGYNALSWLTMDADFHDRRSCLPIHIQMMMELYGIVEAIL